MNQATVKLRRKRKCFYVFTLEWHRENVPKHKNNIQISTHLMSSISRIFKKSFNFFFVPDISTHSVKIRLCEIFEWFKRTRAELKTIIKFFFSLPIPGTWNLPRSAYRTWTTFRRFTRYTHSRCLSNITKQNRELPHRAKYHTQHIYRAWWKDPNKKNGQKLMSSREMGWLQWQLQSVDHFTVASSSPGRKYKLT